MRRLLAPKLFLFFTAVIFSCASHDSRSAGDSLTQRDSIPDSSFVVHLRVIGSHWAYSDLSKTEMAVESLVLSVTGKSKIKAGDTVIFYQTEPSFDSLAAQACVARRTPGKEYSFTISRLHRPTDFLPVDSLLRRYTGGWVRTQHDSVYFVSRPTEDYNISHKY